MYKTKKDIVKIQARYDKMFSLYKSKTMDELKELFTQHMSKTDRAALEDAALYLKIQDIREKELAKKGVVVTNPIVKE